MSPSHFVRLAQVEGQGIISACRHGVVHLSWANVTVRLELAEFERLARLLSRGSALSTRAPLCEGDYCLAAEGPRYRIGLAALDLWLSAAEFLTLVEMVASAHRRLHELLESDEWREPDPDEEELPSLDELSRHQFSLS